MTQEGAGPSEPELRAERSRLIKAERARQRLTQADATALVNDALRSVGQRTITRGQFGKIETGTRGLSEPVLRALSLALGIPEARLRRPLADLWVAA